MRAVCAFNLFQSKFRDGLLTSMLSIPEPASHPEAVNQTLVGNFTIIKHPINIAN